MLTLLYPAGTHSILGTAGINTSKLLSNPHSQASQVWHTLVANSSSSFLSAR
jgi:hypothetical protein